MSVFILVGLVTALLTVDIQAELPQLGVKSTYRIFDRLHRIRDGIFLGRGPRVWRGEASLARCTAKVTAAGNSHVFGLCCRRRRQLAKKKLKSRHR
jgi:hypothetical protein